LSVTDPLEFWTGDTPIYRASGSEPVFLPSDYTERGI
jgi:hypothetical protein